MEEEPKHHHEQRDRLGYGLWKQSYEELAGWYNSAIPWFKSRYDHDRTLIEYLVKLYRDAKAAKNYKLSDEIREVLKLADVVIINEGDDGVEWMIRFSRTGGVLKHQHPAPSSRP